MTTVAERRDEEPAGGSPHSGGVPLRSALWRLAAGALVVVLLAELAARVLGPQLPVARYEELTAQHLEQLAALDDRPGTLLAGASQIAAGVDPEALASRSAAVDDAYAFWLAGPGIGTVTDTVRHVVLPRYPADTVVIGLTSRELNASGNSQPLLASAVSGSQGFREDAGELGVLGRIDQELSELSALVRYRRRLTSPADLLREPPGQPISDRGQLLDRLPLETYEPNEDHLDQERRALRDYELDREHLESLRSFVLWARERGLRVVLVDLPVYEPEYLDLTEGLAEGDQAYRAAIRELAEETGTTLLDPRSALSWDDPDLWGDVNHLNAEGAERLTAWLAHRLDEVLRP